MNPELDIAPSKGHRDENFPVASVLIAARHRPIILAFYNFVRSADDIADHSDLSAEQKLAGLDRYANALRGDDDSVEVARPLRRLLAECHLSPRHPLDVLEAFRMDAVKQRYADWDELMHYCAYSAAPVGRFVLDVHGESESTWPASDALCAALQVINHLQDCAQDYANLDRVYLPLDSIRRAGAELTALKNDRASPALLACIRELAQRTDLLLDKAAELPRQVRDLRLRMEIAVIVRLARVLTRKLLSRDPLSQETHASKLEFLGWSLVGMCEGLAVRGPTSPVQSSSARGA